MIKTKDFSHVQAVKYGIEKEDSAVIQYVNYFTNKGKQIKVHKCGVVVNPNFPWLAASPDRIVLNEDVGYGLIEVKCCYSKKNVTPTDACSDPGFYCSSGDGQFSLEEGHEYYSQVQGQLGICGAK